jgi:hypothetical protein
MASCRRCLSSLLPRAEGREGVLVINAHRRRLSTLAAGSATTATTVFATITAPLEAIAASTEAPVAVTPVAKITTSASSATSIAPVTAATASATAFTATAGLFETVIEVDFLFGVSQSIALAS